MDIGRELLDELNICRKEKWTKGIEEMDFTHSSRKAWSMLKKLGCVNQTKAPSSKISANDVASRLVQNSKQPLSKQRGKAVKKDLYKKHKSLSMDDAYSGEFTMTELETAIQDLKTRKAPGFGNMFAEFIKHFGINTREWILALFNLILVSSCVPKMFKKAKIITVIKPGRDGCDVSHYRPISLLYKLLERLLLNRLQPFIDPYIPKEQAAFRPGRSCDEQVLAMTCFIERGFQAGLKTFTLL